MLRRQSSGSRRRRAWGRDPAGLQCWWPYLSDVTQPITDVQPATCTPESRTAALKTRSAFDTAGKRRQTWLPGHVPLSERAKSGAGSAAPVSQADKVSEK